jgi:hypothetical protein
MSPTAVRRPTLRAVAERRWRGRERACRLDEQRRPALAERADDGLRLVQRALRLRASLLLSVELALELCDATLELSALGSEPLGLGQLLRATGSVRP